MPGVPRISPKEGLNHRSIINDIDPGNRTDLDIGPAEISKGRGSPGRHGVVHCGSGILITAHLYIVA